MRYRWMVNMGVAFSLATTGVAQEAPMVLTLDEYVKLALDQGIRGRLTTMQMEQAGFERRIAFRQTDSPNVTGNYSVTRNGTEAGGVESTETTHTGQVDLDQTLPTGANIDLSLQQTATASGASESKPAFTASATQPLYLFVKNSVRRTRRQATLAFENAKTNFEADLLSIRSQARSRYYNVIQGQEAIIVEERKVTAARKLLDITEALVEAGKKAPVETMRAKLRLQSDERQLHNVRVQKEKATIQAKNFVLLPFDRQAKFVTELEFAPFKTPYRRLLDHALLHRPTLLSLRRARELASLNTQIAREPGRPALLLNGGYGYADQGAVDRKNWSIGGQARWLFFDAFITRDRVRIARIAEQAAELNLIEAERNTRVEVYSAYLDVKRIEKQIEDFETSRVQARRNVEVLRLRFQNGLERLIDVFDAENEMRNLENEFLNLLVQFNTAKDSLSELVGGDVEAIR